MKYNYIVLENEIISNICITYVCIYIHTYPENAKLYFKFQAY